MKARTLALLGAMTAVPASMVVGPAIADAQPPYCVKQAWHYADGKAGKDRTTEAWDFYNSAFQDYNDCNGPNACDDVTRPCTPPPGI